MISNFKIIPHKKFSKINLAKIALILFSSFYLIGNFQPYYDFEGIDAMVYALTGIEISNGSYEINNILIEKSGRWEFVPNQWVKTVHNTVVPQAAPGLPFLTSAVYLITNGYGLFYLGPILTIGLLIVSERFATKLFDERIGFLTLLLLSTNFMIFTIGDNLNTDPIFTIFVLLGTYYFLKFFKHNQKHAILLSSIFFVAASSFRVVGFIFLPLEVIFFIGYLIYYSNKKEENINSHKKFFKRFLRFITSKKTILFFILLIIPWISFFVFWSSYNSYYFGDPLISYGNVIPTATLLSEFDENSFLLLETPVSFYDSEGGMIVETIGGSELILKRTILIHDRLEAAKGYFLYLLPSQFPWAQTVLESYEKDFGNYFLGFISILFLPTILFLSFKTKSKRFEITIFTLIILAIIGIYSISTLPTDIVGRYMLPAIPFFSILLAYLVIKIFKLIPKESVSKSIFYKGIKIGFLVFLIIYFSFAFIISDQIQWIVSEDFRIKNPDDYIRNYPLDKEGLSENSILVNYFGSRAIEYGVIPFNGYIGTTFLHYSHEDFSKGSVQLLKIAIDDSYDAYTLKEPKFFYDKEYFRFLFTQNLVLKDFSKSFCKIEIGNNSSGTMIPKPDQICYEEMEWPRENRWYDNIIK